MLRLSRTTKTLLGASALSFGFAIAPISVDFASPDLGATAALAKGGGGGGGGGGNGNGHGNASGQGAVGDAGRGGPGNGYGRDNAPGQVGKSDSGISAAENGRGHGNAFGHSKSEGETGKTNNGARASALGSLNAAHALSKGNTPPAAPNSRVGQLAAYRDFMNQAIAAPTQEERDIALDQAEASLQAAANKGVTDETRAAVNDMLGIDTTALDSPPGTQ